MCPLCNTTNQMKKLLTTPSIILDHEEQTDLEVGEITKEYIESNREILEKQKKEATEDTYEPS